MGEKQKKLVGEASIGMDCAWKCCKCCRFHVQQGSLAVHQEWQDETPARAEAQLPLLLRDQVKRINKGHLAYLELPGVCEGCGQVQPWGKEAWEKLVPTERGRFDQIAMILGMILPGILAVGMLFYMFDFSKGFPTEMWVLEGVFLWLVYYFVKAYKYRTDEIKHAGKVLKRTEEKMLKKHQWDRFPLVRTGTNLDWMPSGKDARKKALNQLNNVYEPVCHVIIIGGK